MYDMDLFIAISNAYKVLKILICFKPRSVIDICSFLIIFQILKMLQSQSDGFTSLFLKR